VADFSPNLQDQAVFEVEQVVQKPDIAGQTWLMFTDGAANVRGSGLGIVLKSPQGDTIARAIRCDFRTTNNEAEYEALIAGLNIAIELGVKQLEVSSDSMLMVNQISGSYAAKDSKMIKYLERVKLLTGKFSSFKIMQIPRDLNTQADALANLGSNFAPTTLDHIPIVYLPEPSIDRSEPQVLTIGPEPDSWTKPLYDYLVNNTLPTNRLEARALRMKATRYVIIQDVLFKRSANGICMRCIEPSEVPQILQDMHEGICGNHAGGRSLANRALTVGFYWPTLRRDSIEYARKCTACQKHSPMIRMPAEFFHPISASWPFMKWGMDIVGKLPEAPGGKVFMLAVTDYFSKWIEADAFKHVTETEVISFLTKNVITRYGIPSEIVCDNGTQFVGGRTRSFCKHWNISLVTSTPRFPQANGQAESSNKIILGILKKKLTRKRGKWVEELPLALCADRTSPKVSTGQTPFSLVYGCEAVVPTEVLIPTARYGLLTDETNSIELASDLDTVEELRDKAKIRLAAYQQAVAKTFNKNVKIRQFSLGDLVLREVFDNTKDKSAGKLADTWEGPYIIHGVVGQGAYRLKTPEGSLIKNSWNAAHLRKFYT